MKRIVSIMFLVICIFALSGCQKTNSEMASVEEPVMTSVEELVELSPQISEMVGTYHVNDYSVTNTGKELGISESDIAVCSTVTITDKGEIICDGLFNNSGYRLKYDNSEESYLYKIHTEQSGDAGYVYNENYTSAQDYILDSDYKGPTMIDYYYADSPLAKELSLDNMDKGCIHIYLKIGNGTDAWDSHLECSKNN